MSVRENLLRFYRWRLQERQDYLAGLESLVERLQNDARRVREEAAEGAGAAAFAHDERLVYPPLGRSLVERQIRIERSIVEVERQIGEARSVVSAAVQQVKHCLVTAGPHAASLDLQPGRTRRRRNRSAI